jgi:hypothetical protein
VDTSGGNVQFLLPDATAVTKGAYYRFKKISASNTVTFTPTAQTIDGASSFVLAALNSAILIESDGANWKIWSSYGFPGSVDLQEIAAPAAPSSGVLRAYAASNDILTVQGSGGVKQPLGAGLPGVTGLTIANDPSYLTTKIDVTISAGLCVNQYGMVLPVAAGTYYCATGSIGIGGLDISSTLTGTNGLDLYLYLVTNGSTSGVLASLTAPSTGPSLVNAAGYTYSCYIGAVKLDSSGNLYLTRQRGRDAQYVIAASGNTTAFPFSASGSTFNTWTAERVTGSGYAFPSTAVRGKFIYGTGGTSGYCAVAPNANYGAPSGTISNPWAPNSYYGYGIGEADFVLESNSVYYWSNQANSLLQYIGWTDAVNAC